MNKKEKLRERLEDYCYEVWKNFGFVCEVSEWIDYDEDGTQDFVLEVYSPLTTESNLDELDVFEKILEGILKIEDEFDENIQFITHTRVNVEKYYVDKVFKFSNYSRL